MTPFRDIEKLKDLESKFDTVLLELHWGLHAGSERETGNKIYINIRLFEYRHGSENMITDTHVEAVADLKCAEKDLHFFTRISLQACETPEEPPLRGVHLQETHLDFCLAHAGLSEKNGMHWGSARDSSYFNCKIDAMRVIEAFPRFAASAWQRCERFAFCDHLSLEFRGCFVCS